MIRTILAAALFATVLASPVQAVTILSKHTPSPAALELMKQAEFWRNKCAGAGDEATIETACEMEDALHIDEKLAGFGWRRDYDDFPTRCFAWHMADEPKPFRCGDDMRLEPVADGTMPNPLNDSTGSVGK